MKNKQTNKSFKDDGRVIAPMNVDGMPWYNDQMPKIESPERGKVSPNNKMGAKETIKMVLKLYGIIIPIALVFIVALVLFIVFTGHVWLK